MTAGSPPAPVLRSPLGRGRFLLLRPGGCGQLLGGLVVHCPGAPLKPSLLWSGSKCLKILPPALSESVVWSLSFSPKSLVCRCSKELNQWEALTEYGQSKGHINPYLVLECAWWVSNWTAMKEALV